MERTSRIFVAGHQGLVGSAIGRVLSQAGFSHLIRRSHDELDLTDKSQVRAFFQNERPEYIFLAAARVGGIKASGRRPAEFMHPNLAISATVIPAAHEAGVKRLLSFACSCIYPTTAPQPLAEATLLQGPLEPTCEIYALAKIASVKLCEAHNRQFGTQFLSVCPPTLYGIHDNFDLESSHVIAALLRRFAEAAADGVKTVPIWGGGRQRREFLIADDFADACVSLMSSDDATFRALVARPGSLLNVGPGHEIAIADLSRLIAAVVGFGGDLTFDSAMPAGAERKVLDCSGMHAIQWKMKTPLADGLQRTYAWYQKYASSRTSSEAAQI